MKKKLFALTFAAVFAFLSLGSYVVVTNTYFPSQIEMVEAALSSSQTRTVQTKLKRWGYYKGTVDGIYGNLTRSAVKYFQRKNGLVADGIVGKKTAAALGMTLKGDDNSTSNNDLYLLAKCVPHR